MSRNPGSPKDPFIDLVTDAVIFTKTGGCIIKENRVRNLLEIANQEKEKIPMKRERGVYTYNLMVRKPPNKTAWSKEWRDTMTESRAVAFGALC